MKKVFVIKTQDDGNVAIATNKKEVANIIMKYVQGGGKNLKLMNLVEGGNGDLIRDERIEWADLKFVEVDDKAYWNKVYTNICKQFKDSYHADFNPLFIRGEKHQFLNSWDSFEIQIEEFEVNKYR
tara:strand:- start:770 stop:1147 length:378 start_codon:yes stop_codon:yes gene_type:complete